MFSMPARCASLTDLVDRRTSLRQQEFLLHNALSAVQEELRCWGRHRNVREACGQRVPSELRVVWEELGERERELALDLLEVRAALLQTGHEIQRRLRGDRPIAS